MVILTGIFFHRRNRKDFQELLVNDKASLGASNYVRSNPTVIFSHGFTEDGQTNSILKLRDSRCLSLALN